MNLDDYGIPIGEDVADVHLHPPLDFVLEELPSIAHPQVDEFGAIVEVGMGDILDRDHGGGSGNLQPGIRVAERPNLHLRARWIAFSFEALSKEKSML